MIDTQNGSAIPTDHCRPRLDVKDVDIGGRWVTVTGKGAKQRRVPLDADVASVIDVYLLAERPESETDRLFLVAKGPHRGQGLTPAGRRTIFRYPGAARGRRFLHLESPLADRRRVAGRDRPPR